MEIARRPSPELEYEPTASARPVSVEQEDGTIRVLLPMTGIYAPIPKWTTGTEVDLGLIPLALLMKLISFAVALIRRRPNPPRAVFEIDGEEARILFRDPSTGDLTRFKFPRTAMFEARVNRFEKGF